MADSQETLDLRRRARRRLVGAIALVLALIIVPPWIMDLEPQPASTRLNVEIPAQEPGRLKPLAAPPKPPVAPASEAPSPPRNDSAKSVDAKTVAGLSTPRPALEPPNPAAAPASTAAAPARSELPRRAEESPRHVANAEADAFVVTLGSFANADNVKQLQARLTRAGVKSYTEAVKTASGAQTRVRAGPYASREAAEQAREKLKGLGIDAGAVTSRQ